MPRASQARAGDAERGPSRGRRLGRRLSRLALWLWLGLLLSAALALCAITIWIVAPAPTRALLPLGVAAPELSPWLLLAAIAIGVLALVEIRAGRTRRAHRAVLPAMATLALALIAILLAASPLVRLPSTIRRFDDAMTARLGANYLERVPATIAAQLRPRPVDVADFIRGIPPGAPRIIRDIEFARPDGVPLRMHVYRPPTAGPFPIVIQIYGGSWQRGEPGDDGLFASVLASKGYVVFAVDYRHAPQWQWPSQREDIDAALDWIDRHAAEYDGDISRMALLGRSAGAQLALVTALAGRAPGVKGVISFYGPVDLAGGWRHPPSPDPLQIRSILEAYLGGTPDDVPDAYRAASPLTYVEASAFDAEHPRTLPATLLLYGARDHIVEPHFARTLDARLRAAGGESILLEIPWGEHAFDVLPGGLSAQLALYYTERFLARVLYGREPQ